MERRAYRLTDHGPPGVRHHLRDGAVHVQQQADPPPFQHGGNIGEVVQKLSSSHVLPPERCRADLHSGVGPARCRRILRAYHL